MTAIFESLRDISTGYSVFEKDQVLTHDQLNSLVDYTDDQGRLTRVKLLGTGLISGLRPSFVANTVHVSAGVGVTTDGDLLFLDSPTTYTHYRAFDKTRPVYPPLYVGQPEAGQMRTVYELLRSGEGMIGAMPLAAFPGGQVALVQMVVVAYMESYVKDDDLCTGTDCDNLGQDFVNQQVLLLVASNDIAALVGAIDTPADAYDALPELSVGRPQLLTTWTNAAQLANAYRAVCETANRGLQTAFVRLARQAQALGDILDAARPNAWSTRLIALSSQWASVTIGLQYYYDLLKDLTDTWNALRELLFDDRAWLHAPPSRFAKHLLIGTVQAEDPDTHRTPFYPSPMLQHSPNTRAHAGTLLRKIDAMLTHFEVHSDANQVIRVTPSGGEDHPLENRAIPIYYPRPAIVHDWSHAHRLRRTTSAISSYHAAQWGAATNPLVGQIARFDFFRVEGHIGRTVDAAITDIEALIRTHNLPFTVEAVMLHSTRLEMRRLRQHKYTDLHRLHYLIRQDVALQLQEVETFGSGFKGKFQSAADLPPTPSEGPTYQELANRQQEALSASAGAARQVLKQRYSSYKASPAWKSEIKQTVQKAGEIKSNFGAVMKTEFVTPLDILIGSPHLRWLEWLDGIIEKKQENDDDKLLFGKFMTEHPGLDHIAGVTRGGTFVLVYDDRRMVIADFSLAYRCCVETDEEPEEQELPAPDIKPPWVITDGIRIVPPWDKLITDKLRLFEDRFKLELEPRFELQLQYLEFQKTYTKAFDDLISKAMIPTLGAVAPQVLDGGLQVEDEVFHTLAKAAELQNQRVEQLMAEGASVEMIGTARAAAERAVGNLVQHVESAEAFKLGAAELQVLSKLPSVQRNTILTEVSKRGFG